MPSSPAPGALDLVRRFVNTVDLEDGDDQLADPERLAAWLADNGLAAPGQRFTAADLERARSFREALRALLQANAGHGLRPDAVEELNRAAGDARLVVHFAPDGRADLEPEVAGIEQSLGRLLAIAHTAMVEGTWQRLKACANATCQWAFYDHSKNRSGRWCTMETCGNLMKARAYRQRHAASSA
jgi:predicted RNA-binding Zn ribbon-like protein